MSVPARDHSLSPSRSDDHAIEIETAFASFNDYWGSFILGQGPAGIYVSRMDKSHIPTLRAEVKRLLALTVDDQPFTLTAKAWAVRGTVPKAKA